MKIIFVSHGFPPFSYGGGEVYAYNLAKELAKRHEVFIFARVNDFKQEEYEIKKENLNGFNLFFINNTLRKCFDFELTYKNNYIDQKFVQLLDEVKPDLVHIQHLLYLSSNLIKEIKQRHIPIIFTLHDYWLICPQGQLLKNDLTICCGKNYFECTNCIIHQLSIKKNVLNYYLFFRSILPNSALQFIKNIYLNYAKASFMNNKERLRKINKRLDYIREIIPQVDLFISPSHYLRNKFIEFGIPKEKIIFSQYGFNLDDFKNFKKIPAGNLRFAFIGNIMPSKGLHVLIKAFNQVNNNVELKIYGQVNSYKGILANYLKQIRKSIKNKNIKLMGSFENKDIFKILSEIDVLIVPSIWPENSPLVVQEAFAARMPVIASSVGGIPELIQDNLNGLLFNLNDSDNLYEKIKLVIGHPGILKSLEKNISPPKDIQSNALEIEQIYQCLVTNAWDK